MANYSNLLATIAANIYTNHNNEVTAAMVKAAADAMVASMSNGYIFGGLATPSTDPSNPDEQMFYIAMTPGTYTNFGGATIEKYELAIFKGSGTTWTKEDVSDGSELRSMEARVGSSQLLFEGTSLQTDVVGDFQTGEVIRLTAGNGNNDAITLYGFHPDNTFDNIGSILINSSETFVLEDDYVKLRVDSASTHPITLERLTIGTWEAVMDSLLKNWFHALPYLLRKYEVTDTSAGVYPQVNLTFDVKDGEWFNLTPVVSEMYIIWDDYSFTRINGGWQKMTYPAGRTLRNFRLMVSPAGTQVDAVMEVMTDPFKDVVEYLIGTQVNVLPPIRALVLGDSYSATSGGDSKWIGPMLSKLPPGSSYISLAVVSATLRDKYADRVTYPYTSRPSSADNSGNLNTLACQVEKLKRLMAGVDLDTGETQLYTDPSEYPNVIIIAAGKNDSYDSDAAVATYPAQLNKVVTGVYRKQTTASAAEVGDVTIKTPLDEIDRTCFAGAYRYLLDELLTLFPDAQIYFATVSPISYRNGADVCEISRKVARQQRECADIFTASVIDWYRDGQINSIQNYAQGDGTAGDPYIWGECTLADRDTNDQLHPNGRGNKKYGYIAASVIRSTFMDIEDF